MHWADAYYLGLGTLPRKSSVVTVGFVLVWLDHKVPKCLADSYSWVCPSVFTVVVTFEMVAQKSRVFFPVQKGTLHSTKVLTETN